MNEKKEEATKIMKTRNISENERNIGRRGMKFFTF